jgi:hypothetical protein
MFVTKSAAWALRCGLAVSGRTEGLTGSFGWKVWLEVLLGSLGAGETRSVRRRHLQNEDLKFLDSS